MKLSDYGCCFYLQSNYLIDLHSKKWILAITWNPSSNLVLFLLALCLSGLRLSLKLPMKIRLLCWSCNHRYDEIKDYDYQNPVFSLSTGHFTAVSCVCSQLWVLSCQIACWFKHEVGFEWVQMVVYVAFLQRSQIMPSVISNDVIFQFLYFW